MLSLTAKHFVADVPDDARRAVMYPPSWFVSIEPLIDGSLCLAYRDGENAISVHCQEPADLKTWLRQLSDFEPGMDTAIHRSYFHYDFSYAMPGVGCWEKGRAHICLNSCADVGHEPEALKAILAWFARRLRNVAPESAAPQRLALWAKPPQ